MAHYQYKALTTTGREISGDEHAESQHDLENKLSSKGLILQSANVHASLGKSFKRQKLKPDEFYIFNQEFIALLKAATPLPVLIGSLADRPEQKNFGSVLRDIEERLKRGEGLSDAFSNHANLFDSMYITSLKVGEQSGNLIETLSRYQQFLAMRVALSKKVKQAMAYPVFLLFTLVLVLGVLFTFVLPRFAAMYAGFDAELPLPTQYLITFIEQVHVIGPIVIVIGILMYIGYRNIMRTAGGRYQRDRLLLMLPLMAEFNLSYLRASLSRTLSTLLASGMPIVDAINTAIASTTNTVYQRKLAKALDLILGGKSLSEAFSQTGVLPSISMKLLQAGETSGKLSEMLMEIADFNEQALNFKLTRLMSIIEPLMMLCIGILVGGIILVMYLPIFSVADIIK